MSVFLAGAASLGLLGPSRAATPAALGPYWTTDDPRPSCPRVAAACSGVRALFRRATVLPARPPSLPDRPSRSAGPALRLERSCRGTTIAAMTEGERP